MDNQHIDERYELYCKMLDELDRGLPPYHRL